MDLDNEEIEATKKLSEKTADEMFEELGYMKIEFSDLDDFFYRKKDRQWRENGEIEICLNKASKEISIEFRGVNKLPAFIGVEELQAINKKIKELRMDRLSEDEIMKILKPMTKDIDCLCVNCPFLDKNNCLDRMCKEEAIQRNFRFI